MLSLLPLMLAALLQRADEAQDSVSSVSALREEEALATSANGGCVAPLGIESRAV